VEVTWIDAVGHSGWQEVDGDLKPCTWITRGYLINESSEALTLANTRDSDWGDTVGGTDTIPIGMVKKKRRLNVK
jgi:hypothetical protein